MRLTLLSERWEKQQKHAVFIREILMFCDEKPAWYAQTKIPERTYARRAEKFKHLQGNPLGSLLFSDPQIIREDFFYAYLTKSTQEYKQAMLYYTAYASSTMNLMPSFLWARKSVFRIEGEPLYLMEVFFPELFEKVL